MSEPSKTLAEKACDLDEIRKSLEDAAKTSGGVWISYLFVFFFVGIAAAGVTHSDLLLERPVKLPFLSTEVPLVMFFFLAPILFVLSHIYMLMHCVSLAAKTKRLNIELIDHPDVSEDRIMGLLPINIFVQLLAGPEIIRNHILGLPLKMLAWTTLFIGPVLLLLYIQLQFLPYYDEYVTNAHRSYCRILVTATWVRRRAVQRSIQKFIRNRDLRPPRAAA